MVNVTEGKVLRISGLIAGTGMLLLCMFASLKLGATTIRTEDVLNALFQYDDSVNEQIIVKTSRMPRTFIATAVGASLAIAGTLIQAITKNPLAEPNVLGINFGASFFVVFAITTLSIYSMSTLMWVSFCGAAVSAIAVYVLGSVGRDGLTPLKIILAGAALSALFSSFTQGLLVLDEQGLNDVMFWLTGSVSSRSLDMLLDVLPYMAASWVAAFMIARHINVLTMGEDAAKGLGQRTLAVKLTAGLIIVLLAGSSVAVAGPIGFIGMIIPYMARYLGGVDYRWMLPYSGLLGAILLLLADLSGRFVIRPEELPVGVMTAFIGIPFFIYVARKGLAKSQ